MSLIAVIGSRYYLRLEEVRAYVRALPITVTLVSGGAIGVDAWAETTAKERGLSYFICRPQAERDAPSERYRLALLDRNRRIADLCDRAVIFWDGESRGTKYFYEYARSIAKPCDLRIFKP